MQVQTEGVNLAVVEESRLGSSTMPTTGWYNVEPNSYGNLGSSFKKLPRDPISKEMQQQRGMLVDEDSGIPFEMDVTKDAIDRFAGGVFRVEPKHSGNKGQSLYHVSAVSTTGYSVTALGDLAQHFLIVARGFGVDANNGLKEVGAASTGILTKTSGLATEASPPSNATIEVAGYRGIADDIQLDSSGNLISTTVDFTTWGLQPRQWIVIGNSEDATHAFATAAFQGAAEVLVIAAHKITLGRRSWAVEAKAHLDLATVTANIDTVVQAQTAGSGGNSVTVRTLADGAVAAKAFLALNAGGNSAHIDTVVQAKVAGINGNLITVEVTTGAPTAAGVLTEIGTHVKLAIKITATATTVANLETLIGTSTLIEVKTPGTGATSLDATDAFDSAPLASGTAAAAASLSEVGSAVTIHFTPGATTVAQIEAVIASNSTLIEVKSLGTPGDVAVTPDDVFTATALAGGASGADDGSGKTIDVYFTRWYRNVAIDHADYDLPSYGFEMTYQTLGDDGSARYEYMLGNMIDEWVWNIPLASKATINATFVGTRTLPITSARKTGPSTARDAVAVAGLSTATDLMRLRISNVDETGISTDFQSLKITVKNNVSPQKQLGQLGARFMNQGKHLVMVEADVIFTSSEVIDAVADNRECTLDVLMRNGDFGALLDIQALTLMSSDRKFEKDKSVMIMSKGQGHRNNLTGSTESLSVFAYLPAVAVS